MFIVRLHYESMRCGDCTCGWTFFRGDNFFTQLAVKSDLNTLVV